MSKLSDAINLNLAAKQIIGTIVNEGRGDRVSIALQDHRNGNLLTTKKQIKND